MRRLKTSSALVALATIGATALGPSAVAAPSAASARTAPTNFALAANGFGTRVTGGQAPVGSDTTAYAVLGCTNRSGITHENHQAEETLPGVGTASELKTVVWSASKNGVVSSTSRSTIADMVLSDSPMGSLELHGIKSVSRAFHDAKGFHSEFLTHIASITFTPAGGDPQAVEVPAPGQPVVIPGVATLSAGAGSKTTRASGASAQNDAVLIDFTATGTRVRVAHTLAQIDGGIKSGVFGGFSSGSTAKGLAGNVSSGHTPYLVMPCQGTGGNLKEKSLASVDLGQIVLQGLNTRERAGQTSSSAAGFERAAVANLNLGNGQLVVKGIVGRANVARSAGELHRNTKGTSLGTITANGEPQTFPDTDVLEIPGVARLERNIATNIKGGIRVVALRVTLLDGSGAVIDLGEAKFFIRASGN